MAIYCGIQKRVKETKEFKEVADKTEAKVTAGLEKSKLYTSLPEEQKELALKRASDYATVTSIQKEMPGYEIPSTYAWVGKVQEGAPLGLDATEYILYKAALSMYDQPEGEQGHGSVTQDETEAAILALVGLSDAERAYLWQSQNKNWKAESNPW